MAKVAQGSEGSKGNLAVSSIASFRPVVFVRNDEKDMKRNV